MDPIEKLQQRNNEYAKHHRSTILDALWVLLAFSPFITGIGLNFYSEFFGRQSYDFEPAILFISAIGFGLPLLALGSLVIFPSWLKMLLGLMCEAWFCYYWLLKGDLLISIMPLLVTLFVFLVQSPKIKAQAKKADLDKGT